MFLHRWPNKKHAICIAFNFKAEFKRQGFKNAILKCIVILQEIEFHMEGTVCDNHARNVSAYSKLLPAYEKGNSNLSITANDEKMFLFFDTVHMKNIRINFLTRKKLFPFFYSEVLHYSISVVEGEVL